MHHPVRRTAAGLGAAALLVATAPAALAETAAPTPGRLAFDMTADRTTITPGGPAVTFTVRIVNQRNTDCLALPYFVFADQAGKVFAADEKISYEFGGTPDLPAVLVKGQESKAGPLEYLAATDASGTPYSGSWQWIGSGDSGHEITVSVQLTGDVPAGPATATLITDSVTFEPSNSQQILTDHVTDKATLPITIAAPAGTASGKPTGSTGPAAQASTVPPAALPTLPAQPVPTAVPTTATTRPGSRSSSPALASTGGGSGTGTLAALGTAVLAAGTLTVVAVRRRARHR
ncbi:hypothetical protein ACFW1A_36235 [Kitasatospora sp. NPDC058965]|uniref:hypothetical protein n=1 Tax=Kitasatospora sp. NPDC058965 TaxID=3346682 RepID=UPI0036AB6E71